MAATAARVDRRARPRGPQETRRHAALAHKTSDVGTDLTAVCGLRPVKPAAHPGFEPVLDVHVAPSSLRVQGGVWRVRRQCGERPFANAGTSYSEQAALSAA